jgi:chromosome segregation ATPase
MPDALSPADELEVLKQTLDENQTKASELARGSERLKAQIADLEKTVKEVDQKKKDFEKAAAGADQKKKELLAYVTREKQMLEATVPAATIKAEKKKADDALKALEKDVKDAAAKARDKATELGTAKAATAAKQADFNKIAGRAAANDEILKDLTALRAAADKQSAANNLSGMYFVVLVMEERLAQLELISPADQEQQLNEAGTALAAAVEAERTAKEAFDAATEKEKQARKDLDTARAKSRQATLDSISEGTRNDSAAAARNVPPSAKPEQPIPAEPPSA